MICEHRDAAGRPLETIRLPDGAKVCARCVNARRPAAKYNPISVKNMFAQMDYAAVEARAMTAMMREVGIEFVGDEAMGTAEQYEEFKKRWTEKYPDRSFVAMYGSKPD